MPVCKEYDPSEVRVVIGGVIITGFADGSKIKVDPVTKELRKSKVGVDGDVTYTRVRDPRYTLTMMLKQDSPSNIYMDALKESPLCVPISVSNTSGGKFVGGGTNCKMIERPSYEWSSEDTNREYKFMIPDFSGSHLPE